MLVSVLCIRCGKRDWTLLSVLWIKMQEGLYSRIAVYYVLYAVITYMHSFKYFGHLTNLME